MKTKIIIFCLLFCFTASAQDVIVTHDSKRIDAKVEEVSKEYK